MVWSRQCRKLLSFHLCSSYTRSLTFLHIDSGLKSIARLQPSVTHSHLHAVRGRLPSYFHVRGWLVLSTGMCASGTFLGLDRARRGSTTGAVVRTVQKPAVRAVLGQGYGRARLTARKLWLLRSCSSSKVDDILVVPLRLIPMVQFVRKTIEIPHLQCFDQVVDVPVVRVVQVSQPQVLEDTVVNPQLRSLSNSL